MAQSLPDVVEPKVVSRTAAVLADREADVAQARADVQEATRAIEQAQAFDRGLLAGALDAGRDDPGTPAEDAARPGLAEAERRLAGEEFRLQRAQTVLDEALTPDDRPVGARALGRSREGRGRRA